MTLIYIFRNKIEIMDRKLIKCEVCHDKLSDDDLNVVVGYRKMMDCDVPVCRDHWCNCIPRISSWNYVTLCSGCGMNYICKSCKYEGPDGSLICEGCSNVLRKYGVL